MDRRTKIGLSVGMLLLAGIVWGGWKHCGPQRIYPRATLPVVGGDAVNLQNAIVEVARIVRPAVVQITTEKTVAYRYWDPFGDMGGGGTGNPFDEFFNMPRKRQEPRTFKKKQEGLGSGFIVDEKGYILTNNHVVNGVDKILVKLMDDEKKYEATVVGTDQKTDVALIKVNINKSLPAVRLADSDRIQVGEWAIAIGNPMGLEESVSLGVVSAKGRSGFGISQYEDFIQTDAAINPGNSGGPLVNIRGEVMGINTFILSPYTAQNVGFAIPINLAKSIFSQLRERGKVTRGYLGIYLQSMDDKMAKSFGMTETAGALVSDVVEGSPAEKAGIREGDVILEYNGKKIKEVKLLQMEAANTAVGSKASVVVWRNKKMVNLDLVIGEMPADEQEERVGAGREWRGVSVAAITDEVRKGLEINDKDGVVITAVAPDSPAAEQGLAQGMIIKMINDDKTTTLAEYEKAIKKAGTKGDVRLWVKQGRQGSWVILGEE